MPRPGVSFEAVKAAYEALEAQGLADPGVHRVRAYLGTGNPTTISRHKKALLSQRAEAARAGERPPMPEAISRAAESVWENLLSAVEAMEQDVEAASQARIQAADARVETVIGERDTCRRQLDELQARLDDLEASLQSIRDEREDLRERLSGESARREAAEAHAEREDQRAGEYKVAMARISREAAEAETAHQETLTQLRSDHERERKELSDRIASLESQLAEREQAWSQRVDKLEAHRRQVEQHLAETRMQASAERSQLQARSKASETSLAEARQALETEREARRAAEERAARLESDHESMARQIGDLRSELAATRQRIEGLVGEKASCEAELRRLQRTGAR